VAGGSGGAGSAGASFPGGSAQATETTSAAGIATSPPVEANATAGAFTATATVAGSNGSASFQLANLTGKPPTIKPLEARLSATVGARYGRPLEVKVLDAGGRPLRGQTVTFTLGSSGGGASGAGGSGSSSAGASFAGSSNQATATTNGSGIAISPRPDANTNGGTFTATATIAGSTAAARFQLDNRAGAPTALAAGAAANESTSIGTRFAIPLAVTATDTHGNPVAGALVTFTAPRSGAGGSFTGPHRRRSRTVRVQTNALGIAVAPTFTANHTTGGYVVKATLEGTVPAAFALVNQPAGN
jgi:protocatechuate 3,4-dioxygenase beta subunit